MAERGAEDHPEERDLADLCSRPPLVLESAGLAVITTDLDGIVRYWNQAAVQMYGWTREEAVGASIMDLTVPDMSQGLAGEIMAALRRGVPWSGAFTARRKDGSTLPAMVTDSGIHTPDGRLVGVVGISFDLGYAVAPLLERSSDATMILTRDKRVCFVTSAGARLFGWAAEQVLGRTVWDLVHPDDRAAAVAHHQQVTAGGVDAGPLECRLRRGDGTWCWVEVVMSDLLEDPALRGVVCNLRDVTERRRDRERLLELTRQLQTALSTRVVIEQAKGMVAQAHGVGVDRAFEMIRRHARAHNARLHDVADAVVNLGLRIPEAGKPPQPL